MAKLGQNGSNCTDSNLQETHLPGRLSQKGNVAQRCKIKDVRSSPI